MMSAEESRRRTNQERIEAIFEFIEKQVDVFPKSRFNEIGLNPRTAELWLKLIEYIQNQPRIRLIQTDHNMLVEKVEGKYQVLMRRMSGDENVPFEQRLQYLTDYLKSLYAREKSKGSPRSPIQKGENDKSSLNFHEIIDQILDAFDTFSILDPSIGQHVQTLRDPDSNHSSEDQLRALAKWQKDVLLDKGFQMNLKRILNREFYSPLLGEITTKFPDFDHKLKRAKQTIQAYYSYLHENLADWLFEGGDK
jgi:hypothetical protein